MTRVRPASALLLLVTLATGATGCLMASKDAPAFADPSDLGEGETGYAGATIDFMTERSRSEGAVTSGAVAAESPARP
ncbi:MAG: hypothetical protein AVDCRST_MAG64-4156, partial [uncultured Phycisphaerae bacterium]